MVFLLIFVYKITTNPSVVKCTKPNKKMYKITKSGFVRSFTFLTPFPCPLQKKTIQYIESLLPCFWKGRLSSFSRNQGNRPCRQRRRHSCGAPPSRIYPSVSRSIPPDFRRFLPCFFSRLPHGMSSGPQQVSAIHIDAHQPDRPTIKNEVCKFPCPKQRTCRLFCDNKLPPFILTAESCAARFRTGRNPSA